MVALMLTPLEVFEPNRVKDTVPAAVKLPSVAVVVAVAFTLVLPAAALID